MKKLLVLVLALCLVLSSSAAFAELEIPRNETVTENGNQWGAPTSYNIYNTGSIAWPGGGGTRMLIYEALYMYNVLTNENEPLLADGPIEWEDDYNFLVHIK